MQGAPLRNSVAQGLRSLTLVQRVPGSIRGRAQKFVPISAYSILHLTCVAGAVEDKDLAVSSDQGITPDCLGIMGEQY